jgi:uncharacterized RDD family membrane protein YckC
LTEVVTGDAVVLDLPHASVPSRLAGAMLDLLVQGAAFIIVLVLILTAAGQLSDDAITAILITAYILIFVGYPTAFETLSRGKSLGKMALGQRIVSDDGSPERFRQALIRALFGLFEISFPLAGVFGFVGLITAMSTTRAKRVGDVFAGTFALQERAPRRPDLPPLFAVVPPQLAGWAQVLEISRLTDQTAEAASSYLRRYNSLSLEARNQLGITLANAVASQISPPPPPGTPPAWYLAAVLAVRRQREQARLFALQQAAQPLQPPMPFQPAPPATQPMQPPMPFQPAPPATQPTVIVPSATDAPDLTPPA